MPPSHADLPPAELEVLKVLWGESPLSVREVMNRLHEQGRDLAYTTVMTYLGRLEQKGCVVRRKQGIAHLYEPRLSRDRVERTRMKSLVNDLYDGAAAPLILRLVRESHLTGDEIQALQTLIDQLDSEAAPAKPVRKRRARKGKSS